MDMEGVTDFRALRAKFQNDSNLADKLVQPCKKPPTKIPPKLGSGGHVTSSPLSLGKREVIVPKPKDEPAHPAARPSTLTRHRPVAQPRAKLCYVEPTELNEEHKGKVLEKGLSSPNDGAKKPLSSYHTDQQGPAQPSQEGPTLPNSFHRALEIWENTLSRGEKASAILPTQRATNLYVQPCPEQRATRAPAGWGGSRMRPSGSESMLDLSAREKDALRGRALCMALPQGPRGHRGYGGADADSMVATVFCQLGYRGPGQQLQHQKAGLEPPICQPGAGKCSHCPWSKRPRIKPLPPAASLGPAPVKPARPPKFDLGAYRSIVPSVHGGNETTADEEDYLTPKSAPLEEQHNYEETPMYLNQSGDTTTLCVIEVPKAEPQEHKKQKTFVFARSSPGSAIIEDEKEEKPRLEREKQETKKNFKTGGNEHVSANSQTKEDGRGGLKVLQVIQDVTSAHPTPRGLTKDGAEFSRYVCVGAPNPGVERTAWNQNTWQPLQAPEDVYDDVEEIQDKLSHTSDASSLFASASVSGNSYKETYEDVDVGLDNPIKPETEKQKKFGNLFKIEKLKLKNNKFKENLRLFSISVPNLVSASREDMVYDDVEVEQKEPKEKDDKNKTWMPKFLTAKDDKDQRKSSEDEERNIFKVKKSSADKSKKMEKEEKFFRETFMYDKEINVINTATVECSVPSKRRVDLPVTAGEQLDIIDVTEGSAVICRNAEGRYGYVLVEHLKFRIDPVKKTLPSCTPSSSSSPSSASLQLLKSITHTVSLLVHPNHIKKFVNFKQCSSSERRSLR